MAHEPRYAEVMTYPATGTAGLNAIFQKPPRSVDDWHAKRAATDAVLSDIGGVVTRIGDETIGEMWSLIDGQDVLDEIDSTFSANVKRHIERACSADPFHVSANTDP